MNVLLLQADYKQLLGSMHMWLGDLLQYAFAEHEFRYEEDVSDSARARAEVIKGVIIPRMLLSWSGWVRSFLVALLTNIEDFHCSLQRVLMPPIGSQEEQVLVVMCCFVYLCAASPCFVTGSNAGCPYFLFGKSLSAIDLDCACKHVATLAMLVVLGPEHADTKAA